MKEIFEFRINNDYYNLLSKPNNGKDNGIVNVVNITQNDPNFEQIRILSKEIKDRYGKGFFYGWQIKRKYTKKELNIAALFQMKIKTTFEPAGEECGTFYDETVACEICGANRKQIGSLKLKKSSIPKKDISRTIAGEIVVSERFAKACVARGLKGIVLGPIIFNKEISSDFFQLLSFSEIALSKKTIAGNTPFETSASNSGGTYNISGYEVVFEKEVYICPKGHLIGLNLLSEAYVLNNPIIKDYDFFSSKQKIGVKRGLLRPEPLYLCLPAFRQMIEEEKLSGFEFEVANIE